MSTLESSRSAAPHGLVPIRSFAELSVADVPYAGGKGANLGQLTQAGMPVPAGFVIGAPAYVAFLRETGLDRRLAELLDGLDVVGRTRRLIAGAEQRLLLEAARG
jgi:pyruvate,water dikinase